jgi:hypothetical protein
MHCLSCFKEKRTRDRHTKEKHENIVLLKCEQCEYQCDRKDNMDRHVKNIMEANTHVPPADIQVQERITLIDTLRQ